MNLIVRGKGIVVVGFKTLYQHAIEDTAEKKANLAYGGPYPKQNLETLSSEPSSSLNMINESNCDSYN
jgi:hypothetical protein